MFIYTILLLLILISLLEVFVRLEASNKYFAEIEKCKITIHGSEYIGSSNRTKSGKDCQKWTEEILKKLKLQFFDFPDKESIFKHNFCRNPNQSTNGPWCIVDGEESEWEYCNVPSCIKDRNWCKDTQSGGEYFGNINSTKTGKPCRSWLDKDVFDGDLFPERNLKDAENKCRNPDGKTSGPWCFFGNGDENWETCDIPMCDENLSQIEYFGGYDFQKAVEDQKTVIPFKRVYSSVKFKLSLNKAIWSPDVQRKTSLWATDYDPLCQTDLNVYEFCKSTEQSVNDERVEIVYRCLRPFKHLIFMSPLESSLYKTEHQLGDVYEINEKQNVNFMKYEKKLRQHFSSKSRKSLTVPVCDNPGYFYLLNDNVIPYAVMSDSRAFITVSEVGNGRIGFMGCNNFMEQRLQAEIKDFLTVIYGDEFTSPMVLTKELLGRLAIEKSKNGMLLTTPVMWNVQNSLGYSGTKLLLDLVKEGLKIIIVITPWAYPSLNSSLLRTELSPIFLEAGIWPSRDISSDDVSVLDRISVHTFPLVHLLHYAKTSLSNAMNVSKSITMIILDTPFDYLMSKVQMESIKKALHSSIVIYLPLINSLIPCLKKPLRNNKDKSKVFFFNILLLHDLYSNMSAPGVSFYPGKSYGDEVNPVKVIMKLSMKIEKEVIPLGLYLPPGKSVSVNITRSTSSSCQLYINHHLFDVSKNTVWKKWPIIKKSLNIERFKIKQFSFPFGGLLSLSCKESDEEVGITVNGVTPIPMYDRRSGGTIKNWKQFYFTNVPWAIISSDYVVFIIPFVAVRNLAYPLKVLKLYDAMVAEEFYLRGKSIENSFREMVSSDVQIVAGYMIAGYPTGVLMYAVTNPAVKAEFLFSFDYIKRNGCWGILHEIGHNLQDSIFTFSGTMEVTTNIFTLVGIETFTGRDTWSVNTSWIPISNLVSYFKTGTFSDWKNDPFLALGTYAQLKAHFGWEFYSQLFRSYDSLNNKLGELSDSEKIQLWITETSNRVKMNLCPFYELWKWPIEDTTKESLSKLPLFLPDDFLTKMIPEKVDEIVEKYGGSSLIKRQPHFVSRVIGPLKHGMSIRGKAVIKDFTIIE